MAIDGDSVVRWIKNHARPIDRAIFEFRAGSGSVGSVVAELATFQNADGGFGHGMEPDLGLPDSTALATSVALQYLSEIDADVDEPIVQQAIAYLADAFDPTSAGWPIVVPAVDDHPHAPWWGYEGAMAGFGWGNPSAELLGYLIEFGGSEAESLIKPVTERAVDRLNELADAVEADFHELLCFKRLFARANDELRAQINEPLDGLILAAVSTNPGEWGGYVCTPLTFIQGPDDAFVGLFNTAVIDANLDHIEAGIRGDHWEPSWDWGGMYPEAWDLAKADWSGKITVDTMLLLKAFGQV